MSLACFVLIVSYEGFLVTESRCEFLGIGKIPATVAAYIDDEAITENEILDDFVKITFSNGCVKTLTGHIADVVVENPIL